MIKPMKLKGRAYLENDRTITFHTTTYDEAPFSLKVDQFDVELNEEFTASRRWVDGWLFVQQEGQQGDVVYLTLPKPSLTSGRQTSVKDLQLMPRNAIIDDFNPQNKGGIEGVKVPAGQPVPAIADIPELQNQQVIPGSIEE